MPEALGGISLFLFHFTLNAAVVLDLPQNAPQEPPVWDGFPQLWDGFPQHWALQEFRSIAWGIFTFLYNDL